MQSEKSDLTPEAVNDPEITEVEDVVAPLSPITTNHPRLSLGSRVRWFVLTC